MGTPTFGPRFYSCSTCRSPIADHSDVISKMFNGRNGRAYLFARAVNITDGPQVNRQLLTGLHTVADVYCFHCNEILGWKYIKAYTQTQKYKEGKFILEKAQIMEENL